MRATGSRVFGNILLLELNYFSSQNETYKDCMLLNTRSMAENPSFVSNDFKIVSYLLL